MDLEKKIDEPRIENKNPKLQTRYSPRELLKIHLIYPCRESLDNFGYMEVRMNGYSISDEKITD